MNNPFEIIERQIMAHKVAPLICLAEEAGLHLAVSPAGQVEVSFAYGDVPRELERLAEQIRDQAQAVSLMLAKMLDGVRNDLIIHRASQLEPYQRRRIQFWRQ